MMSSVGVGLVDSDVTALVLSGIALLSFYAYSTNTLTLPADLAPPGLVASVSGFSGMGAGARQSPLYQAGWVCGGYLFVYAGLCVRWDSAFVVAGGAVLRDGPVDRVVRE